MLVELAHAFMASTPFEKRILLLKPLSSTYLPDFCLAQLNNSALGVDLP